MQITVQHDPANKKFYTIIDGQEALLQYDEVSGKKIWDFHHTYTPPALRGHKVAEIIVKYALDYARANHYQIIPSCPFVQRIIERYPIYNDLVFNS